MVRVLLYDSYSDTKAIIGTYDAAKDAKEDVLHIIVNKGYKPYYCRYWFDEKLNGLIEDFGSWSEFIVYENTVITDLFGEE